MMPPADTDMTTERSAQCDRKAVSTSPIKQREMERLCTYVKKEIAELRQFLAKPVRRFSGQSSFRERWARIAFLAGVGLTANVLFILSIGLALGYWTTIENFRETTSVIAIVSALVFAPLAEEIIFRAGLRNLQYSLFVGPALVCLVFGQWQIAVGVFFFAMSVAAYLHFLGSDSRRHQYAGERFHFGRQFVQHYPKIFWLYTGAFSIIHVTNFSFSDASGLFVVFAVIPQLFMGIFWGYVRLRDGLNSAIALHFLNNLIALSLVFFLAE